MRKVKEELVYLKKVREIVIEIGSQEIVIEKYNFLDERVSQDESDWEIVSGKKIYSKMTDEKKDELDDFISEL